MINRNDPCFCGSGKKYKKCHMDSDNNKQRPNEMNTKNKKKGMVKSPEQIDGMRKAGRFNGELMDYIRPFVQEGVSTEKLDKLIYKYTVDHGHIPACLGYRGYPKSCCISRNNVVCHGIPSANEILQNGDIVNVDITSIVDGYYGDSSETFFIGEVNENAKKLVHATAQALILGIHSVKPGAQLKDIAVSIEPFIESNGFSVVRQYTGHGIGTKFHEFFTVYHHQDKDCEPIIFEPGMTFTIEPMINMGGWEVVTDRKDGWTVRTKDGALSAQFEHTVAVTESGVEILTLTPSQIKDNTILKVEGKNYN